MKPILFEIFGVAFPSYYLMLAVGYSLAVWYVARLAERDGLDANKIIDLALWALVAGVFGARGLHVLVEGYFWDYVHLCTDPLKVSVPEFIHVKCSINTDCIKANAGGLCHPDTGRCHPVRDCFAALKFWYGGLTFLGGLLAATAVSLWFMRRNKMAFFPVADVCVIGVAIGSALGRLGCFLGGCCFGARTTSGLGVQFPGKLLALGPDATCPQGFQRIESPSGQLCATGRPAFIEHAQEGHLSVGADLSIPVLPSQVFESLMAFVILALLLWRRKKARFAGQMFYEFLILYSVGRFAVEFARGDDDRGSWLLGLFSTSQLIVVPIVLWAIWKWRTGHVIHGGVS